MITLASSSAGNCYLWHGIMIECGIPIKKIMRGVERLPRACLITHEHQDHAKAAEDLVKLGVQIYASSKTLEALNIPGVAVHGAFQINESIRGYAFPVEHDASAPMAFVLDNLKTKERLFFATDTASIIPQVPGCTEIAIEANYSEPLLINSNLDQSLKLRIARNHLSLESAIAWLKKQDLSRCHKITLLHLSAGHSDADLFKRTIQEEFGIITKIAREK